MYNIIKSVLNSGNFELTQILKKIAGLWAQGTLTDAEYEELNTMARCEAKLEELDKRISAVENGSKTEDETAEEYPEFVVGKWYYKGDKVSFEGKNYVCIAPEGTVCVWSPKDYPAYWE